MKSIKLNFIYNVLLNVSSVIFPLITAPYVARVLEPDGVGLFNFAGTYAGYFALVALLGIPTYGVREVAKTREDKQGLARLVSEMMSIALITTVLVSAIYILSIAIVGQLKENYIIFILAGFAVYLAPFKINWYYQGLEEFGFITLRTLIIRILSIICLFLFVREKNDLIIYIIINVSSIVIADIWNFTKMWRSGVHPFFTTKGLKKHLKPLWILFASSIAISIYTVLDTLMLGFIKDYTEVGYYNNAMHMSRIIISAITSLSVVAVPRVSYYMQNREFDKINELLNKSFSFVSFIAFPVAIGLICISPTFVPLFFGEKFYGSVLPLMVLSLLVISIGLNNLTGVQTLIGMGYDKQFLFSVLIGTVTNFILNIVFIPMIGAVGASISSVIAESLILFVTTYFVYKKTNIRFKNKKEIMRSLLGALLMLPLLYFLRLFFTGWWLVGISVALGAAFYLGLELILKNQSALLLCNLLLSKIKK